MKQNKTKTKKDKELLACLVAREDFLATRQAISTPNTTKKGNKQDEIKHERDKNNEKDEHEHKKQNKNNIARTL